MGDAQTTLRPLALDDYVAVVELWRRCEGVGMSADEIVGGAHLKIIKARNRKKSGRRVAQGYHGDSAVLSPNATLTRRPRWG